MGLFHASRDTQGDDRFLRLKVIIFVIGAALGIAGMSSRRDWLVATAIGVLAIGIVLRVLSARQRAHEADPEDGQPH
jgi:hypothetical protein